MTQIMNQISSPASKDHWVIFARHGNTFLPDQSPTRVGARTDLPLVETKKSQAIGEFLKSSFTPDQVFASPLIRTQSTAQIALETAGLNDRTIIIDERFREIDYGPDENQTEDRVIARIGQAAIDAWDSSAQVPDGWLVNPEKIQSDLSAFLNALPISDCQKTLVVTSNGILRFLTPCITPESLNAIEEAQNLKVKTGHLCLLRKKINTLSTANWECVFWNLSPEKAAQYLST